VLDERERFFAAEYSQQMRTRAPVVTAVDSLWQQVYRAKFERFLNNTSQRQGDLLLSLPIGGEGRTAPGSTRRTMVAVPFPARRADAVEALYVLAHEITGSLVGTVVADNTTPAARGHGRPLRLDGAGSSRCDAAGDHRAGTPRRVRAILRGAGQPSPPGYDVRGTLRRELRPAAGHS
jgi:hypothetical protein